jgi:hypothetical protein
MEENSSAKSSVIEAIDLVLGPDRIDRLNAIMSMIFMRAGISTQKAIRFATLAVSKDQNISLQMNP